VKSEARSLRTISEPGLCTQPREKTLIVGITGDGYVPVVENPAVDLVDVLVGVRSVISLPSVVLGTPGRGRADSRDRALEQLRREFGYEGDELVPMETSTPPGFLLAPLLRSSGWRERIGFVPGVYEVPLHRVSHWLRHRRLAGAVESRNLRRGLALARKYFPRWARLRLCRAIHEIEARSTVPARRA
jgi:hypothetical protein